MNTRTLVVVVLCGLAAALVLAAPRVCADEDSGARAHDGMPQLDPEAERAAARLLEAMKQGDDRVFWRMLDVTALYHEAVRRDEIERSIAAYWDFVAGVRRGVERRFSGGPLDEFDYEIVSSDQDGAVTTVTVAFRIGAEEQWQYVPVAFETRDGGKRKLTLEGMRAFDFGFGERGPISRRAAATSAEAAIEAMLEARKEGDIETFIDYVDLKDIYDQMAKGMGAMGHQLPEFEEWKRDLVEEAKAEGFEKGFDYEVLEVREQDGTAKATVKTRNSADDDWEEQTVEFKLIDGGWKVTVESLMEMVD
jgi:hypothetical protein